MDTRAAESESREAAEIALLKAQVDALLRRVASKDAEFARERSVKDEKIARLERQLKAANRELKELRKANVSPSVPG